VVTTRRAEEAIPISDGAITGDGAIHRTSAAFLAMLSNRITAYLDDGVKS
jgi:hypothetical protein